MNYEDEPYVRLYVRRTATNRRLGWEGRAVMHEMLYEFDRAGVFDVGDDPLEAIELVTRLPLKVIKLGLERLFKTKTWELRGAKLVWPTFLEAQTAKRSDAQRAAEYRARRRDGVTVRDESVTQRDEESRDVTVRHEESRPSQNVTLCSALPSSALLPPAAAVVTELDPSEPIRCPVPLPVPVEALDGLELDVGMPRKVAEVALRDWARTKSATSELRTIDGWISWAIPSIRAMWSADKAKLRAAAEPKTEPPETTQTRIRTGAEVLAARGKGAA